MITTTTPTTAAPPTPGPVTYELSGVMTALSSIAHASPAGTVGNATLFRREMVVQPDGTIEQVPVISGNGIRGRLRDLGMAYFCQRLGYGSVTVADDGTVSSVEGLPLPAFYLLFSGGNLSSQDSGAKALNLQFIQRLQTLVPLLSVFGGAYGNHGQHGKLKVDKVYLLCQENRHLLPASLTAPHLAQPAASFLQEEGYTRTDDAKNLHYHGLLASRDSQGLLAGMSAQTLTKAGPQQMRYEIETAAAGTLWYWRVLLCDVSELEFEAFLSALLAFSKVPYIGGRSAIGHGHVAIAIDQWQRIDHRVSPVGSAIDVPLGTRYHDHLTQHRDDIRAILAGMV